jgi:hypothetical protein
MHDGHSSDGIQTGYHPNDSEALLLIYLAGHVLKKTWQVMKLDQRFSTGGYAKIS